MVTSMLITMPTPQAPEPDGEKTSSSTFDGIISLTGQRLGDIFFGVHEVLRVQQPTRTVNSPQLSFLWTRTNIHNDIT